MNPRRTDLLEFVIRDSDLALDGILKEFRKNFLQRYPEGLLAIVLYGSCMSAITRSSTSIFDFFLIVSRYGTFHEKPVHAFLNHFLPPNIYETRFETKGLGRIRCKFNVITLSDLRRETSPLAGDFYHLGRFSKRMKVLWARDKEALRHVSLCRTSAMEVLARLALGSFPAPFAREDFIRAVLGLSYAAETRIEAADKISRLYAAGEEYYRRAYGMILDGFVAEDLVMPRGEPGDARFESGLSARERRSLHGTLQRMLARSRRRSVWRWPKHLFTYDNWVDYMLEKLERSHGIVLDLKDYERRHPFIFGWSYFFKLRRDRVIK
jgi:hypothetical protein